MDWFKPPLPLILSSCSTAPSFAQSGDVEIDKVYVVEKADTSKPRVTLLSEDVLIIDWLHDDQAVRHLQRTSPLPLISAAFLRHPPPLFFSSFHIDAHRPHDGLQNPARR